MGLTIVAPRDEPEGGSVKVDRRLYLNKAGELVEDGDPGATCLYASKGKRVSRVEFEDLGGEIVDPDDVEPEAKPAKPAKAKKAPAKKKAKAKKGKT